jgi:signal transduction histidine kinase
MTSSPAASIVQPASHTGPWAGRKWLASTGLALAHLLLNLPLGVFYFAVLAVGLSLGTGLLITLLGMPILIGMASVTRALSNFERARLNAFLGTSLRPHHSLPVEAGWVARLSAVAKDAATWRDLVFLLLRLPVGLFTFTAMVGVWSVAISLLLSPVFYWLGLFQINVGRWVVDGPEAMLVATGAGAILFVAAAGVTYGLAKLENLLAAALLAASPEELQRRVDDMARSRSRTISLADRERRRLERDLHDGAQQRIVSLAMTLGLAQQKLATNPEQGARLVKEAHEEAKRALQDLRDLARGLHPAVLTDHGLDAALPALAARCPIATRVDATIHPRPEAAIESAAYFVVSEALTNVARHSQATEVLVTARRDEQWLTIEVRDDGVGGARSEPGGGLAGLNDRVDALGGRVSISSPPGGPTVLRVELPCGS